MEKNISKKDAWDVAYKNFLFFSFIVFLIFVLPLPAYLVNGEKGKIAESITVLLSAWLWYSLAQLFKKRDKKAVLPSYIFLTSLVITSLFSPPFSWVNIIFTVLISSYFFFLVYKVSKVEVTLSAFEK